MALIKIDIRAVNEQLSRLVNNGKDVAIDEIPEQIREGFIKDIAGQTVYKKSGRIWVNYVDFLSWVKAKYE